MERLYFQCNRHFFNKGIALALLLLGFYLAQDYGTFWDSMYERRNGLVSLSYALDCLGLPQPASLPPLPTIEESISRHYGVLFNLPMAILEVYGELEPHQMIYFRNAFSFLIFYISGVFLFRCFSKKFDFWIAWAVVLFYGLAPRIYGEAFFNSKDLSLTAFFLIAILQLDEVWSSKSLKKHFEFGLSIAMISSLRVIGFLLLGIFIVKRGAEMIQLLRRKESFLEVLLQCCVTGFVAIGGFILLNPYLWRETLIRILECLMIFGLFEYPIQLLFCGKRYFAFELPRYYLILQIVVTTPPWMLFAIFIASMRIVRKIFMRRFIENASFISFSLFWGLIALQASHNHSLYDGWRHFYFLWAPATLFTCYELVDLYMSQNVIQKRLLIAFCMTLGLISNVFSIIKLHPYENLYFSSLAGKHPENSFDMDYWGTTHLEGFRYLLNYQKEGIIPVYMMTDWNYSALLGLTKEEALRFRITPLSQARYSINDFRFGNPNPIGNEIYLIERNGSQLLSIIEQNLAGSERPERSVMPDSKISLNDLINLRTDQVR